MLADATSGVDWYFNGLLALEAFAWARQTAPRRLGMYKTVEITRRGRCLRVPARDMHGVTITVRGRLLKVAQIFDEYWLERDSLPSIQLVIDTLLSGEACPDLFVFTQRVPEVEPIFDSDHDLENFAVLPLSTYDHWFKDQITSATRRNIRASEKRGVTVKTCEYDDGYVNGISSIYNESPTRAGRSFWHYGKSIDLVRRENGTYASRSTFLAATLGEDMVGYMKIVWDVRTAAIMQILSKTSVRDCRPNNALMAEAIRQACARGVEYLIYEKFDYGNKTGDSLTRFKQGNGFVRMDVPRYCVPLTRKGRLALKLGLHKSLKERVPETIGSKLRDLRAKWYAYRATAT